jgi:putative ABC transport system permease protein
MELLGALGTSRRTILTWLAVEAAALGVIGALFGFGIGVLLAKLSLSTFGSVTNAWVRIPTEQLTLTAWTVTLAIGIGIVTTMIATLIPAWSVGLKSNARLLHLVPQSAGVRRSPWPRAGAAIVGLGVMAAMVVLAPATLPFAPLVAYVFAVNCLILVSFALMSPLVATVVGRLGEAGAVRTSRGISTLLSSSSIARNPTASVAVVAAIIAGLGSTLADASLIASFKRSWLDWVEEHYQSDLIVSGGGALVTLLTAPPISEDAVRQIREVPGVRDVQGVRLVDVPYRGKPIVVQALDEIDRALPVTDGTWVDVAAAFWSGSGALASDNLARKLAVRRGTLVSLTTPSGEQTLPILGVFSDFQGGDLGSITMSRVLYERLWGDSLVNRIRVWIEPGADVDEVRRRVERGVGDKYGLRAVTAHEFRAAFSDLVDRAFALSYALVAIALSVSFVGVMNLLLAAVLDRRAGLRTLDAIGVTHRQIAAAIVVEGGIVGVIGAVLGLAAGFVASWIIVVYAVPMVNGWQFNHQFPMVTALALSVGTVVFAAGAGAVPARLAITRHVATEDHQE